WWNGRGRSPRYSSLRSPAARPHPGGPGVREEYDSPRGAAPGAAPSRPRPWPPDNRDVWPPASDTFYLGVRLEAARVHQVESVDVGLGRRDDDIGVGTITVYDTPALLQPDGHFALGVRPFGNRVD